jgi:hypothetical protein
MSRIRVKSTPLSREVLESLYITDRLSISEIASKLNITKWSVQRSLAKHNLARSRTKGIEVRVMKGLGVGPHPKLDQYEEDIKKLYLDGMPGTKIAKKYGVGENTIYRVLHRLGVHVWNKSEARFKFSGSPIGTIVNNNGYARIKIAKSPAKWQFYHIYVWEQTNGRRIAKGYLVHHLNGIKDDNRPCNLAEVLIKKHSTHTLVELIQQRLREVEQENYELCKKMMSNNE